MSEIKHSKNIVAARIDAEGNVIVGDGNKITVINLKEAAQYKSLEADIAKLNNRFERAQKRLQKDPDDSDTLEELLEIDTERSEKRNNLETLKREVLKLAEDLQRIPIDTERLRLAKQHFDAGDFEKARAVFDAETMGRELDDLEKQEKVQIEKLAEIKAFKSDKANEYLFLARLTATDFDLPDRFEKTKAYFEQSLRADRNVENLFAYAYFLQKHNQFGQAQPLYEEALEIRRALAKETPAAFLPDVAMTLNNLAILQKAKNEFAAALENYEEALAIYRVLAKENPAAFLPFMATTLNNLAVLQKDKNEFVSALKTFEEALEIRRALAKENPTAFLPDVAMTLNNLAVLQKAKNEFAAALENYEEALEIYRALAKENPTVFLPYLAGALNNLANLHSDKKEFSGGLEKYEKALQIYRALSKENPAAYLPNVAMTLNNLAILHSYKNEFAPALEKYEEALEIYRALAKENPAVFLADVAKTVMNFSIFYLQALPDKEKSIAFAVEAVEILMPVYKQIPYLEHYLNTALQVLQANGVDVEKLMNGK